MVALTFSFIYFALFIFCVEWAVERRVKNAINELLAQHVIQFTGKLPPAPPAPPYPEELRKMEEEARKQAEQQEKTEEE